MTLTTLSVTTNYDSLAIDQTLVEKWRTGRELERGQNARRIGSAWGRERGTLSIPGQIKYCCLVNICAHLD